MFIKPVHSNQAKTSQHLNRVCGCIYSNILITICKFQIMNSRIPPHKQTIATYTYIQSKGAMEFLLTHGEQMKNSFMNSFPVKVN